VSHAIHHTKAIVLGIKNLKEAHRMAILYTQDFGLMYVHAQSIRKHEAKMRYHLQFLSMVHVDLVQGRDIWRLTGIHEDTSSLSFVETPWYGFLDRVATILYRLCQGEESNDELWEEIIYIYSLIQEKHEYQESYEIIVVVRVLSALGYWSGDELLVHDKNPYHNNELVEYVVEHRKNLVSKINLSLKQSQL
jgi:recombinational DNA repair protein (RecF pathway)